MKLKLNRCFLCIALLLHLISVMTGTVAAADPFDFEPDHFCSIEITLAAGSRKIPVVGAKVIVYRVADINITEDGISFDYGISDFANCGLELDDIEGPSLSKALLEYARAKKISGISDRTDSDGYVCFEELYPGLYLVAQTDTVEGFTAFKPFLTYLPVTNDDLLLWDYEIDASPKIDIDPVPPPPSPPDEPDEPDEPPHEDDLIYRSITVCKVWNDDGENRPKRIIVRLLNSNGVYDEVELSESNGWSYTWDHLDYYENWYVQEVNVPDGYTVTYYEDGDLFTVVNTAALAQTGQLKWPIPILGGCGLLLVTAGFVLKSAGRRQIDGK